jgi:hypothetical protein
MDRCTLSARLLASPFGKGLSELSEPLLPLLTDLGEFLQKFLEQEVTPTGACQFERELHERLRQLGRALLEGTYNLLEADAGPLPAARLCWEGECYRRRGKSPNRCLDSLFGRIRWRRYRYEPLQPGERSLFPLEMRLGIEAERATPALAERVGQWAAQATQKQVLAILRRDHGVCWAAKTLRKVTHSVSAGMAEFREAAQVNKLADLLKQAEASTGRHRPTLVVGRDGIMLPLRDQPEYREGATGTVSVLDRQGQRLGTVYVARMPEAGQKRLSKQLTGLIVGVLALWTGLRPRLQYITDAGHHPVQFFKKVLKKLCDPFRPDKRLQWIGVIDYYHATTYIAKMAQALFVCPSRQHAWMRKMCHWLKHKRGGVNRVLHSAAALRRRRKLTRRALKEYQKGYDYLRKYLKFMDYASYRGQGLAIGSGVTEAACKTVFTQRLKQSGMTWYIEGGQVILDLRVILLSGVWEEAHDAYLAAKVFPKTRTQQSNSRKPRRIAA